MSLLDLLFVLAVLTLGYLLGYDRILISLGIKRQLFVPTCLLLPGNSALDFDAFGELLVREAAMRSLISSILDYCDFVPAKRSDAPDDIKNFVITQLRLWKLPGVIGATRNDDNLYVSVGNGIVNFVFFPGLRFFKHVEYTKNMAEKRGMVIPRTFYLSSMSSLQSPAAWTDYDPSKN